jgi:hypothetical protein
VIWVALLGAVVEGLTRFAVLLPDGAELPIGDTAGFFTLLGTVNGVAPVDALLSAVALVFGVEIALSVFVRARALYRLIPFIGGH